MDCRDITRRLHQCESRAALIVGKRDRYPVPRFLDWLSRVQR